MWKQLTDAATQLRARFDGGTLGKALAARQKWEECKQLLNFEEGATYQGDLADDADRFIE